METQDDLQPLRVQLPPILTPIDDQELMDENINRIIENLTTLLEKISDQHTNKMQDLHKDAAYSIIQQYLVEQQHFRISLILTRVHEFIHSCMLEIKKIIDDILHNRILISFDLFLIRLLLGAIVVKKIFHIKPSLSKEVGFFASCLLNSVKIFRNRSIGPQILSSIVQEGDKVMNAFSSVHGFNDFVFEFLA